MTQFSDQPVHHTPSAIVYRDEAGDLTLSLDGGRTSFYITVDGKPAAYSGVNAVTVLPGERELWRTGPDA